jgi:hypothetical protein
MTRKRKKQQRVEEEAEEQVLVVDAEPALPPRSPQLLLVAEAPVAEPSGTITSPATVLWAKEVVAAMEVVRGPVASLVLEVAALAHRVSQTSSPATTVVGYSAATVAKADMSMVIGTVAAVLLAE